MNTWLIVLVSLIFSAFFSGMEIAFVSSNKLKIELDKNRGLLSAKIFAVFIKYPSRLLGALLLGNNIALVIYGMTMAVILEPLIYNLLPDQYASEFIVLIIQTIIATIIILIAAEFIPKALFRINPNMILNIFAVPIKIYYWIFYPFIHFNVWISEFILNSILRQKLTSHDYTFSPIDLDNYLKEFSPDNREESEVKQEIQLLQNAIDFRNIKLRECMIPRIEITALEQDDSIENLKSSFIESGHSKILIYKKSLDNIIGFVHSSDMFKNPVNIKATTHSLPIVPEAMLANNVLKMFIKEHKSIALVVDEFGGTSGIVTMEDIIEEIFGEIEDEYDVEELDEKQLNENEFLFSARLEIDFLNEKYNLDLPESDDYETLGGLIINIHESIPEINEVIIQDPFKFIITEATNVRIEQVHLFVFQNGN
ncbi:MAG: hemolysin family protein [Bacteroidales bacterium]|nr:hemolysin family protein [Bacteroidales bacterium]